MTEGVLTQTPLARVEASFVLPPLLAVTHVADDETVHIGATPIARYPTADVTMRRHVMVQLAEAGGLTGVHIAERFHVRPVYVSLLRGRMRTQGSVGLAAKRRGPHGAMKVTGPLVKRVRALRQTGLSYRAIATAVGQVSHQTVRPRRRYRLIARRARAGMSRHRWSWARVATRAPC